MRTITHVLFDMDGLLLDTEKFYSVVQEKILSGYGKSFTWSLKAKMMGKRAAEAAEIFVHDSGLEGILSPRDFLTQREAMLEVMFPESQLLPGVERLVGYFQSQGIPMAIATSSHKRNFDLKTINHKELISHMHHVVVGDDPDVKLGKPAPDIFLVAASRFPDPKPRPENVLVFEDAPTGVEAAQSAGMSVVMVPDPNLDKSLCDRADIILETLEDFDPSTFGMPPFI
ncbi:hypothetical protein SELMODRAFT_108997 [Selaginella moellendorffii]|uniref:glycerol-1-phosphatase n=1 Tax=Selaginella moellendorffii TaxID=88036 RepID=D8S4X2_SELML|nr:(DL)-glycerol-3-phosphatase 1, mitochondrial isoform X1 [Selaginella moellendorffii]EFJ20349.1 hypothetical protein SELMODRAFT_108997 [Selaginella moellendorffii]|eukprot:XP_002978363.1 (DL)-glycerol-3-phosphatase 1, mitochondrial isoform X1 [Selaginella moellendorffii]